MTWLIMCGNMQPRHLLRQLALDLPNEHFLETSREVEALIRLRDAAYGPVTNIFTIIYPPK